MTAEYSLILRSMKQDITTIKDCRLIQFDATKQNGYDICSLRDCSELPYTPKRMYYLYEVPAGSRRGGHSHKECLECLVAASGSFEVTVDDGSATKKFTLNRPDQGLLITTGIWRTLKNFSSGSVCLVFASLPYDEDDYIRQYSAFLKSKNKL